jgi:hypothetical protein
MPTLASHNMGSLIGGRKISPNFRHWSPVIIIRWPWATVISSIKQTIITFIPGIAMIFFDFSSSREKVATMTRQDQPKETNDRHYPKLPSLLPVLPPVSSSSLLSSSSSCLYKFISVLVSPCSDNSSFYWLDHEDYNDAVGTNDDDIILRVEEEEEEEEDRRGHWRRRVPARMCWAALLLCACWSGWSAVQATIAQTNWYPSDEPIVNLSSRKALQASSSSTSLQRRRRLDLFSSFSQYFRPTEFRCKWWWWW